jgi:hypothetical protein
MFFLLVILGHDTKYEMHDFSQQAYITLKFCCNFYQLKLSNQLYEDNKKCSTISNQILYVSGQWMGKPFLRLN